MEALNPAQREAVVTCSGPLLVLAGAGTGKTRVVTCRIAHLIERGVSPQRILAVTFTNKAAQEMHERVTSLVRLPRDKRPHISTFHSLCVGILRRHATRLGYPARFTILDQGDQEMYARRVVKEIRIPAATLKPSELVYHIGRFKSAGVSPHMAAHLATTDRDHLLAVAYRRYQSALKAAGSLDFDDLLVCTEELFRQFCEVRREEAARFDYILIDEYQDTNASQYRIVKALAAGHRNLCVVGDDDQSIYAWRGADVQHILGFCQDWPEAKVVRLEQNYRSTQPILDIANRLIAHNRVRHVKTLHAARSDGVKPRILQFADETTEAREIVADIQRLVASREIRPGEVAILFRTNEQPRVFEMELRRAGLPYALVGSQSFFDRKEVRDLLAYLRILVRPQDDGALLRIINVPPRGIGERAVRALIAEAARRQQAVWQVLANPGGIAGLNQAATLAVQAFHQLIQAYHQLGKHEPPAQLLSQLIDQVNYRAEVQRQYSDDPVAQEARWVAVEELVNAAAGYECRASHPTLIGFLDEATLVGYEPYRRHERGRTDGAVILMTLHSAKGLEFPHVYMVGLEEGLLPHRRSLDEEGRAVDEERRLCYVGITRAQVRLTLSLALTRMKWGKPRPTQPSRFLFEIAGQSARTAATARKVTRVHR